MVTLSDKYDKYLELIKSSQDAYGFICSDQCDSLLFSGLVGCSPGVSVYIDAALDDATGMWHRTPKHDCYPDCAPSTISKDMFIGLAWYIWHNKRLDLAEQIISHYYKHFGIMGKGPLSRTWMSPNLIGMFAEISFQLGGPDRWWFRKIPSLEISGITGFQAHLQVLGILLRKDLGTSSDKDHEILFEQALRQPQNPLFQYAAGNKPAAEKILLNAQLWPETRLPTEADRDNDWLLQRDYGDDWLPSQTSNKVLSGGDFVFATWLVLNK